MMPEAKELGRPALVCILVQEKRTDHAQRCSFGEKRQCIPQAGQSQINRIGRDLIPYGTPFFVFFRRPSRVRSSSFRRIVFISGSPLSENMSEYLSQSRSSTCGYSITCPSAKRSIRQKCRKASFAVKLFALNAR